MDVRRPLAGSDDRDSLVATAEDTFSEPERNPGVIARHKLVDLIHRQRAVFPLGKGEPSHRLEGELGFRNQADTKARLCGQLPGSNQ